MTCEGVLRRDSGDGSSTSRSTQGRRHSTVLAPVQPMARWRWKLGMTRLGARAQWHSEGGLLFRQRSERGKSPSAYSRKQ